MDSILQSIKKLLGIANDDTSFDQDIIININTALAKLKQMGVGPKDGCSISGNDETWDIFTTDVTTESLTKTFVYLSVKQVFDPPSNSVLAEAINKNLSEIGWRLYIISNYGG